MGRNRSFNEADVVEKCAATFRRTGYEGTSVDDLVQATGLHRGSLYQAFGSKRGLFLLVLRRSARPDVNVSAATDLLLIALMELAPRDREIRSLAFDLIKTANPPHTADSLGRRLLERAHETTIATSGGQS